MKSFDTYATNQPWFPELSPPPEWATLQIHVDIPHLTQIIAKCLEGLTHKRVTSSICSILTSGLASAKNHWGVLLGSFVTPVYTSVVTIVCYGQIYTLSNSSMSSRQINQWARLNSNSQLSAWLSSNIVQKLPSDSAQLSIMSEMMEKFPQRLKLARLFF